MKIGAMELVVIFIVALLVIGPDKLPQYARKFGAAMREFRKASQGVTQEIRESVIDPLEEAQKPLREAMEPIEDITKGLKSDLNAVEKDLKSIGKTKPQEKKTADPAEKADPAPDAAEKTEAASVSKETNESAYENRNPGAYHHPDRCHHHLWTDTDPEADQDVRQERQELQGRHGRDV